MVTSPSLPDAFLRSLFDQNEEWDPITLCAGFDGGKWRGDQLAEHLVDWIIEFALRTGEINCINSGNLMAAVREAASRVFAEDHQTRGEAGEILLHAGCRQQFRTDQLLARMYYKSSLDEQMHGFDCVHFRESSSGQAQLWLGEAKLHASADTAIPKARQSIREHLDRGFIKAQKILVAPKIREENPDLYVKVERLLHRNTPIDDFLSALVVPVLIAVNSDAVYGHSADCNEYRMAVRAEMDGLTRRLRNGEPFCSIRIQPIYVPILSKEELRKAFGIALSGKR